MDSGSFTKTENNFYYSVLKTTNDEPVIIINCMYKDRFIDNTQI
jgi:hypothetical protein